MNKEIGLLVNFADFTLDVRRVEVEKGLRVLLISLFFLLFSLSP